MESINGQSWSGRLDITSLRTAYAEGLSPAEVVESIHGRIDAYQKIQPSVWIHLQSRESIVAAAKDLETRFPDKATRPFLFGIPFSIKDNIDIASIPTTTACPPLARTPKESAPVYRKLIEQGGLFIGKTNLEQLATGMTGCRSPYGTLSSVYHKDYTVGGSSSGSCVSVAAGLVSFSIGSDTAGSGRLPAAFNGIVGWKPTKGTVSAAGVTPACQSQDCIAVLTKDVEDARVVWQTILGYDENDIYAKPEPYIYLPSAPPKTFTFGVPSPEALVVCSQPYRLMFDEVIKTLQSIGGKLRPIDWTPFENAGKLLYEGTFVAERLAGLPDGWLEANKEHLHPVTRRIFEGAANRKTTAIQVFRDLHAQQLYTRQAEKVFLPNEGGISVLLVPTAPTHYTISEVLADPVAKNSALGDFAHFANVVDLCAIALPVATYPAALLYGQNVEPATTEAKQAVLPYGVTLLGPRFADEEVLDLGEKIMGAVKESLRAKEETEKVRDEAMKK